MIKCRNCGFEFDDLKQSEVVMGGVKCPKCNAIVDQEGNVFKKAGVNFFSHLVKIRKPYLDTRGTYTCECIDCAYVKESKKHCKDIKCPKCGGEMRRKNRPGSGKKAEGIESGS